MTRLPDPALVVLVAAAGSGTSTWARSRFRGDDLDRFGALADLGGDTVIVGVADLEGPEDVSRLDPMTA